MADAQSPDSPQTYECTDEDCTTEFEHGNGYSGHCSCECYHRNRGRSLLNLPRHDHRFCFTCFRQVKETESLNPQDVGPIVDDALTSIQYLTEHGQLGEVRDERGPGLPDDTRIGTICTCGQTGHQDREEVIRNADIKSVVRNLYTTLEAFREEGQHDKHIDLKELVRALREQVQQGSHWDFPLAVGRAIVDE